MRQISLFPREKKTLPQKQRTADEINRVCADIILSESERYGGTESLMVQWSKLVIERTECLKKCA